MNISIGTAVHWFILSLVSCVCSVLSKEQGITVLAVCICYDFFIHHKVHCVCFSNLINDYFQNNLCSSLAILNGFTKGIVPVWFKCFIYRFVCLVGFFIAIMILRMKIMKAELPVFTM